MKFTDFFCLLLLLGIGAKAQIFRAPQPPYYPIPKMNEAVLVPVLVCKQGWTKYVGNCYKVFNEKMTQQEASDACQRDQGAHLVSIRSSEENRFVNSLLDSADPSNSKHFWIGLKLQREVTGCQWTDASAAGPFGCHYNGARHFTKGGEYPWARYTGFQPEPNNWGVTEEACVVIGHDTAVQKVCRAGWLDWPCNSKAGFVCKKKVEEEKAESQEEYDSDCS